jgi:DNA-binding transcriptional MerR regulator
MTTRPLRIQEAAARVGVSADTLRHYERLGLISKPARTAGGYREYSEAAIARLQFIRHALVFGFSLKQIGGFLRARESGTPPCHDVRRLAADMAIEMDRRIEEMLAARAALHEMLAAWDARLRETPEGQPARLLEMTATTHGRQKPRKRRP